ncbi:MAG TPA: hypothetical protein VL356_13570 [Acidocella sp.]|jgi:hypothetical protein|nr:hypothetical protein [Acidocella sp.]
MSDFATKFAETSIEARSDVSLYRSSMLWTPDWEPHDEWLEAIPFLFWLMDVLRPRDVVVVGEGVRDVFYTACQAAERFRGPARIRFFTQADESTAFIGAERIRRARWQGFSEVKRGGGEAVLQAADGIDLLCLSRSETARMDFETFSALRGRIRRTGGLLLEDPAAAEAVLEEEPRQLFSFRLNLASGPMVISPTTPHAPRTALQHVFAQFHDEPPLEFMFRGMLNKLGTGLRATASATVGWRTADRYEAELAHVAGALDLARNEVAALHGLAAEAERLRSAHEAELGRLAGALDRARTDCAALQVSAAEAARLRHEIARQRVEFAKREADTQNALAQARAELSAIVSSTSWRLTGPVRSALGRRHSSRRLVRRSLKLFWWAATLQQLAPCTACGPSGRPGAGTGVRPDDRDYFRGSHGGTAVDAGRIRQGVPRSNRQDPRRAQWPQECAQPRNVTD